MSWFTCKKGLRKSSSANMQPAAQTSTAGPYCLAPYKSSGALYHEAKTYNMYIKKKNQSHQSLTSIGKQAHKKINKLKKNSLNITYRQITLEKKQPSLIIYLSDMSNMLLHSIIITTSKLAR